MSNKEDLNKYHTSPIQIPSGKTEGELSRVAGATTKSAFSMLWKTIKTVLVILMLTGLIVFISVASFILSFRDIEAPNLGMMKLDYNSFIMTDKDGSGTFTEYMMLESVENRVWVDLKDTPQSMIDAIVAIEDKRFFEHHGVDWRTTAGAVLGLATGGDGRGGSTLTQQLIKNITDQDQVSLLRKIREIFMALNLEKKYHKDEIMEAYLNVVNFGGNMNGVQAAANLYFDKDIIDCDIAECASIAGITQYPYRYNPLVYPDNNKSRQKDVIQEMYDQEKISRAEYDEAMEKADHMTFVGKKSQSDDTEGADTSWNWYVEYTINQVIDDLQTEQNISRDIATNMVYTAGLEIYCAMDEKIQLGVESVIKNEDIMPADPEIQMGMFIMDYNGKVLAVLGSRYEKSGKMLYSLATDATRQTGSSIKPLSVYAPALENGDITYGSVLRDVPIEDYFGPGKDGPYNFDRRTRGYMNVDKAVEMSQNIPAARVVKDMGVEKSFNFLENNLHFKHLDSQNDMAISPMALGGLYNGATVEEMTAAFQVFGNAGVYNKPYGYYYVKDHDGNVILDNRDRVGSQAMSPENATVMNKLLHKVIYGEEATGYQVRIDGLDIFGKTGTTDTTNDLWFVGGTEFCVAGIWNGYAERQSPLGDSATAKVTWRAVINYLYNNFFSDYSTEASGFKLSDNVVQKAFCRSSGFIAGGSCYDTDMGWYANTDNGIPKTCNGGADHVFNKGTPKPTGTPEATATPDVSETPDVSSPSPGPDDIPTDEPITPPPVTAPPVDPITPPPVTQPPETPPPATEEPPPISEPPVPVDNTDEQ